MSLTLPPGSVGVWPDTSGFSVYEYEKLPPARAWRSAIDELGHTYRYKLTAGQQDVAIIYKPSLPGPGRYVVEVYIPRTNAQARNAGYHVVYYQGNARREKVIKVDQQRNGGRWVSLGTYDLDPSQPASGRVNATDYSPENTVYIAFAGVRWVPANAHSSSTPTTSQPTTTTTTTSGPTNQDVINAFIVGAAQFGETFTDWISAAGIESVYQNRQAAYRGSNITTLKGVSQDRLAVVAKALSLSSSELAQKAVTASKQKSRKPKGDGLADGRTWGVHGSAGFGVPPKDMWDFWLNELTQMGIKWYKQCDNGGDDTGPTSGYSWVLALRDAGITPVIRYQQAEQYPNGLSSNMFNKMKRFAEAGVIWAEIGNEPNLPWEWSGDWRSKLKFHNPEAVRIINKQWVENAEQALQAGVRPAYPAFAPTDWRGNFHPDLSSVYFYDKGFQLLGTSEFRRRAQTIFADGGWLAVHVSTYEQSPDFDPYAHTPVWDMCLRGYEVPLRFMEQHLGINADDVTVMSTEGGVFTPESTSMNNRPRLSGEDEHAQKTLEMFDYIETKTPLQAMMPWCIAVHERIGHKPGEYIHDGWYLEADGRPFRGRTVVDTLKRVHAQRKGR